VFSIQKGVFFIEWRTSYKRHFLFTFNIRVFLHLRFYFGFASILNDSNTRQYFCPVLILNVRFLFTIQKRDFGPRSCAEGVVYYLKGECLPSARLLCTTCFSSPNHELWKNKLNGFNLGGHWASFWNSEGSFWITYNVLRCFFSWYLFWFQWIVKCK